MSDANTIREFLVALGFKVNDASYKKFDNRVAQATASVFKIGAATAATAAAIEVFLAKVTDGYEKLYYLAQRNNAVANNIKALSYAMSQLGSSTEGAVNAIESIGAFIRGNPGAASFLTKLGVDPAHVRNADLALKDLQKTFRSMPYYKARVYGEFLGIDEKTLLALIKDTGEFEQKYKDILKLFKVDTGEAAEKSVMFQQSLRELGVYGEAAAIKLADTLIPVGIRLIHFLESLMEWGTRLPEMLGPFKTLFAGIATALAVVYAPIASLGVLFVALIEDFQAFREGSESFIGDIIRSFNRLITYLRGTGLGRWFLRRFGADDAGQGAAPPAAEQQSAPMGNSPRGLRQNNPGNLRRWGNAPINGGFAVFGSAQAGLSALMGNLQRYGAAGFNTISAIVERWAPRADGNTNNEAYKAFLARITGRGVNDRLNLNDPGTLAALARGITRFEQGRDPYDAALYNSVAAARTGASINQNTTINVTGVPDPNGMSRAIAGQQTAVNNQLVRQAQGVAR